MDQWLQDAHQAGFDANYDGFLPCDNPFGEQTPAHASWATGHAQAQQTRDEWEASNNERVAQQ